MKTFPMAAAAVLFGCALLLPVATEAQNGHAGIAGFLDPRTGAFTTRPALQAGAIGVQQSGSITVVVTATLGSNIPTTALLQCTVTLSSFDLDFTNEVFGSTPLVVKRSTGTCKLTVPYIFQIASTTTPMTIDVSIGARTTSTPPLTYSASLHFSPFTVPKGNKTVAVALAM